MKKISVWILLLFLAMTPAFAQESAAQQQIDKLSGQIQDMLEVQAQLGRRIDALERENSELREKVNTPVVQKDYASRDDLKNLTEKVQEIDRKRQEDRDLIIKQIEKLGTVAAVTPLPPPRHSTPTPKAPPVNDTPATPEKGYEYEIKQGDNLGLIIKAYREKGVRISKSQIIKANPTINPDVLIPGKKLFIPDPSAK